VQTLVSLVQPSRWNLVLVIELGVALQVVAARISWFIHVTARNYWLDPVRLACSGRRPPSRISSWQLTNSQSTVNTS